MRVRVKGTPKTNEGTEEPSIERLQSLMPLSARALTYGTVSIRIEYAVSGRNASATTQ